MKGVSVVICCYNSAKRLPDTIKHLALQDVPKEISWEVILVNNNSNDRTVEVAHEEWRKYDVNIPFKVVEEPIAGLTFAREKGIESSAFDYILFCDDDNWLNDTYVKNTFLDFSRDEKIGVVGGQGIEEPEIPTPFWFQSIKAYYAIGPQNSGTGYVTDVRAFVYGAGMGIRKEIYSKIKHLNYQSPLTGRLGAKLSSGEDVEICFLSVLLGYEIFYDEQLVFRHFIPANRLTWDYVSRLFDSFANATLYLNIFRKNLEGPFKKKIYLILFKSIIQSIFNNKRNLVRYIIQKPVQNLSYVMLKHDLMLLGKLIMDRKKYLRFHQQFKLIKSF